MHQIIQSQQTLNQGNQQNIIKFIMHIKNSVRFEKSINNNYYRFQSQSNKHQRNVGDVCYYSPIIYDIDCFLCFMSYRIRSFLCTFPYITTDSSWRYCIQCQGFQLKRHRFDSRGAISTVNKHLVPNPSANETGKYKTSPYSPR